MHQNGASWNAEQQRSSCRQKQAVREAATICPVTLTFDLLTLKVESGVLVTCDVGYLCANLSLPRPLCSRIRPDVRDRRQTDVRQQHRLMPPPRGRENNKPP